MKILFFNKFKLKLIQISRFQFALPGISEKKEDNALECPIYAHHKFVFIVKSNSSMEQKSRDRFLFLSSSYAHKK